MKLLTAAGLIAVALLASPMFVPLATALPPRQYNVQIISASSSGAQVSVNGVVYSYSATITSGSNGDPTITTSAGYASWPEYIGNPPYTAWWNGISDPPEVYVYINSGVAFNTGGGVGGIAALLAIVAAATGLLAGVTGGVLALLAIDYGTIYGADHNADGSLSLWIPVDWVNIAVLFEGSHDLYVATPNYWWLCLPAIAIRSNR